MPAATATFSESVQSGTISFVLRDPAGHTVASTITYDDTAHTATLNHGSVALDPLTTYTVTVTGVNGFNNAVTLSVSGLPSRTTASFSPSSVTGSGTSTLTISTRNRTPIGTFSLTIIPPKR